CGTARACVVLARRLRSRTLRGAVHRRRAGDSGRAARPPARRERGQRGERRRGSGGVIELSPVGLGTNNFGRRIDVARARAVVDAALEEGVTHLDTADIYGDGDSERFLGIILVGRRGDAILATTFGHSSDRGGSPEYVEPALDASLQRLGTDYVDLLYYHRPDGV